MKKRQRLDVKRGLLSLLLMLSVMASLAQSKITGVVKDETGDGMPGVSVLVKGTTNGVVTGLDGGFSITVNQPNAILSFSFLGYVTQDLRATPPAS